MIGYVFSSLSLITTLVPAILGQELARVPEVHELVSSRYEDFDRRGALQKRACEPGWFSCGDGRCAPIGSTCCANGRYAPAGYFCCPDGSGHSAPDGATCCPNSLYYADADEYCCADYGSCPNGETCSGCIPVGGQTGNGAVTPTPSPTTAASPTTTSVAVVYQYFTYTITYYYYSYYWTYNAIFQTTTSDSTEVTTTTTVSVYASNTADADESLSEYTATASFYTPFVATYLPPPIDVGPTSTQFTTAAAPRLGKQKWGDTSWLVLGFINLII